MPTFTLSGVVFFDYNGNGVQDGNEPPVPGATIKIGSLSATSGADGSYSVQRLPKGKQSIKVAASGFRYISLSTEAFQSIDSAVSLAVSSNVRRDWGLMQGFLTLPFLSGTLLTHKTLFPDLDPGDGLLSWKGDQDTYNGHTGTDYIMEEGQVIVSAAPGEASDIFLNEVRGGHTVFIYHPDDSWTYYAHLSEVWVAVGQRVERGKQLGLSGYGLDVVTGQPVSHLHFELRRRTRDGRSVAVDPNRDLLYEVHASWPMASRSSLWTVDNDPQYAH